MALALLAAQAFTTTIGAQSIAETCVDALVAEGARWDGPPMDAFTWDGAPVDLGAVESHEVTLCRANGPLEILPPIQFIGCVLADGQLAAIEGRLGCGAYREVRLDPDGALLWIARSSAATNEVTRLHWSDPGFAREQSYTACWDDPFTPVMDSAECGR